MRSPFRRQRPATVAPRDVPTHPGDVGTRYDLDLPTRWGYESITVCRECGCAVWERATHDDWHDDLAGVASPTLGPAGGLGDVVGRLPQTVVAPCGGG